MNETAQIIEESEVYVMDATDCISSHQAKILFPELWEFVENHPRDLKFSVIWESRDDVRYRGDFNQFILQLHFPENPEDDSWNRMMRRTRRLEFTFIHWDSCCAQGIISSLEWNLEYDHRIEHYEFLEALKPGFKRFLRSKANVHKVQFAYSEEEITYQDDLAKALGFQDITEPYLSYKTGNTIHNTMLSLASADDEAHAQEQFDENHDLNDYYDDEDAADWDDEDDDEEWRA
jgi:hypothetical protein